MEIKTGISLQTKQVLSQAQVQSLNILSMSMTELTEFWQNEEIENPLVEYTSPRQDGEVPVAYREYDSFYSRKARDEGGDNPLYEMESGAPTVEDLVYTQLSLGKTDGDIRKIVDFCIHSLDRNGYLTVGPKEAARAAGVSEELACEVIAHLKGLEPQGIFAAGLEECLLLQVRGMEQEKVLSQIIQNHLKDVAEGKISTISRAMKLPSIEVRKLIHVIKTLNPRPLNGYGEERAQYIFPDIILHYQDGQWTISLNDKYSGDLHINDFYVHMMETAQDEELKQYFEEKLRRARFIMNAVEQRRRTLERITEGILRRQAGYLLGREPLKPMTLDEIAAEKELHKSTVSRAIRDKYLLAPAGCILIRDLFTSGISAGDGESGDVSRNTVKAKLKELVDGENRAKPYSDEQLAALLKAQGMAVSRRTVAKYRMEMGIAGAFQRREE